MAELLDIYTEHDEPTGQTKFRSDIHKDGDWHRTVNVYVVNEKGEYLVLLCPPPRGLDSQVWGTRFGGHVSAGQTYDEAVVREFKEETGLSVALADFTSLGIYPFERNSWNREHTKIFYYLFTGDIKDLVLDSEEVVRVEWMSAQEIIDSMQQQARQWATTHSDFEFVHGMYQKAYPAGLRLS